MFIDCVNMSDSDDFSDAGEEFPNEVNTVNNHVRRVNKNGVKVRGCEISALASVTSQPGPSAPSQPGLHLDFHLQLLAKRIRKCATMK